MRGNDNQFKYWNDVSSSKIFTHPINIDKFSSLISKDASILDFGCGYGRTCNELYKLGFHNTIGIDSSKNMIERGHKENPHLILETSKEKSLSYGSNTFDAILLFAVLTCVPSNEGQQALINELYRVLKPGGIIYVSDYWLQSDERNLNRYNAFKDKYGIYGIFELPEGAIVRHHEKAWILSLLKKFYIIELFDIDVTTMNGNKSIGFQYMGKKK